MKKVRACLLISLTGGRFAAFGLTGDLFLPFRPNSFGCANNDFFLGIGPLEMASSFQSSSHRHNTTKDTTTSSRQRDISIPSRHYMASSKPYSDKKVTKQVMRPFEAQKTIQQIASAREIDEWMRQIVSRNSLSGISTSSVWSIKDQVDFIRLLQQRNAYNSILLVLENLEPPHVKVCTTAIFGVALSRHHRHLAVVILDLMDRLNVMPTPLTFIAVLGALDGPSATSQMMSRFESYENIKWTSEVFNSAIYACRRESREGLAGEKDWQMALNLLQKMRRKRVQPTTKTYHAVLQVLSKTGKVQMAKSLMQQLRNTPNLELDDRVWTAAINVCAEAADYKGALHFINEMEACGHTPNLLHCSALLKAFSQSNQDQLALDALAMMMDEYGNDHSERVLPQFHLPPTPPDIIAVNTVVGACAKAGNMESAIHTIERLKRGEVVDGSTGKILAPDRITYHSVLVACREPAVAKDLVKQMRLSRRDRNSAVPPSNVTYAHAINVCQRAKEPDLECAETLLAWAVDDGIQPTVYMFAPAIWTAQKSGDRARALEFFVQMEDYGLRPNDVAYNAVISALCDSGDVDHALFICGEMKEQGLGFSATILKRLARTILAIESIEDREGYLKHIIQLMDRVEKQASVGGPVFEALITTFGKQGLIDEALTTFDTIVGRVDSGCLRAVILACSAQNPPRWQEAVEILHTSDIVEGTSGPAKIDQMALGNVIIACSKANKFEEALTLLQLYGRRSCYHDVGTKVAGSIPVFAINSLIAACGRSCRPDLAIEVLSVMEQRYGVRPDRRSYRCAAISCNKAEHDLQKGILVGELETTEDDNLFRWWECALSLLRRMREDGMIPDVATYSATISACEAAGEWQRALGVLQMMMDDEKELDGEGTLLNLYCFNAAISACEKGRAWVEALDLYERMLDFKGSIRPNVVTLNSLLVALDNAGQKELAESKYKEGCKLNIMKQWKRTRNKRGETIKAMDLHRFSGAMAKAAIRNTMDGYLACGRAGETIVDDLVIITGKGLNSERDPVLQKAVLSVLSKEHGIEASIDESNHGRLILSVNDLKGFVIKNS